MRGPDLDHLAVAVERHADAFPRYAGDLGGAWVSGGDAVGFSPAQVRYGNRMKVEILQPNAVHRDDFLRRFLDRRGPGAHHLTFKVPDIAGMLDEIGRRGWTPVGVDLSDPGWKEAFLPPKQACGIVVQLAQAVGDWCNPPPPGFPPPVPDNPADLVRLVHSVARLDVGVALFENVLAGDRVDEGDGWVDVAWPGPGRLRLVEDPDAAGGDPGRFAHIVFAVDDPEAVPGAEPGAGAGEWIVPAAANHGVRLVLEARP